MPYRGIEGLLTVSRNSHMGGCQNYDPFLGTLNITWRNIIGIQKRTIILTTTHMQTILERFRLGVPKPRLHDTRTLIPRLTGRNSCAVILTTLVGACHAFAATVASTLSMVGCSTQECCSFWTSWDQKVSNTYPPSFEKVEGTCNRAHLAVAPWRKLRSAQRL